MKYLEGTNIFAEIFIVRYCSRNRDQVLLTWNGSADELRTLLHTNAKIGSTVEFCDVHLSHNNGILHTKVYHDPSIGDYAIPKRVSDKPSMLLQTALIHATRCCSAEKDFNNEQRYIKLSYLFHGVSSKWIQKCIQQFYTKFNVTAVDYRFDTVSSSYDTFRRRVIEYEQRKVELK
jgi:hypothetical protein